MLDGASLLLLLLLLLLVVLVLVLVEEQANLYEPPLPALLPVAAAFPCAGSLLGPLAAAALTAEAKAARGGFSGQMFLMWRWHCSQGHTPSAVAVPCGAAVARACRSGAQRPVQQNMELPIGCLSRCTGYRCCALAGSPAVSACWAQDLGAPWGQARMQGSIQ